MVLSIFNFYSGLETGGWCKRALNVAMNALLAQDQYKCLNVNTVISIARLLLLFVGKSLLIFTMK